MIILKSRQEIEYMREGGRLLAQITQMLKDKVLAGVTTGELDGLAGKLFKQRGVRPAFLGYRGFPANICISVNEEVIHGIPGKRVIKEGDLVGLDLGLEYKGYYTDMAVTVGVGKISQPAEKLLKITEESLFRGITQVKINNRLSEAVGTIQRYVESHGFKVVRQFVGHGIGKSLWESPQIPNFLPLDNDPVLKEGMTLAIEPMVNAGAEEVKVLANNWTAVTVDGSLSGHFEHTVLVAQNGPEILTRLQ